MIDRAGLAQFLRRRRESLLPADVGLPTGQRRRTEGLRREEVALLCHMSSDYYARLEQERGPQPSLQMLGSIAQGLHLSLDERDHLFLLAGHTPPARGGDSEHVSPGVLRVLDRLTDTPAEVVTTAGVTLRQNALGVALTGDTTRFTGPARSLAYRWFTDPAARRLHLPEDHDFLSRLYASHARAAVTQGGPRTSVARLAELLLVESAEFRELWQQHEIGLQPREVKRFVHPQVGRLDLTCQTLVDPSQAHLLLVYTATPGTESHEKLQLLSVVATR